MTEDGGPPLVVYGAPWCPDCKAAKKFLAEHRVAYDWVDIDQDAEGLRRVEELQRGGRTIPMVVLPDGALLIEPDDLELATALGLDLTASRTAYDVVIVGGGPAGLTAAIYAAREGMEAVVVDRGGLGGQAGVTERIDNFPGFPDGIGGAELADRFIDHARRNGVELLAAVGVDRLQTTPEEDVAVTLSNGQELVAHAVILATGSTYRRLGVPGEEDLIGAGVHFCATCDGPFYKGADELLVIGGGNSALEEALFLTKFAGTVRILQRSGALSASKLLQTKIAEHPGVAVHLNVEILELEGQRGTFEAVVGRDRVTGEDHRWPAAAAFVFIGLDPNSGPFCDQIDVDEWGFVVTDATFQTSMPGVFAAGDVRRGSTKQLGSAVGEGITALLMVRERLTAHHHLPQPTAGD